MSLRFDRFIQSDLFPFRLGYHIGLAIVSSGGQVCQYRSGEIAGA